MASVVSLSERPLKKTVLDASKWKGFAIAYIDENGEPGCAIYANTLGEAKRLLQEALDRLNVVLE
jgi:hypothetical protein